MRRRGITLIEAVLFIAVALGVIVGGMVFYNQASTALHTQNVARLGQALVTEVRRLGRTPGTGGEAATQADEMAGVLRASGAVPKGAAYGGADADCAAKAPWAGCVMVYRTVAAGGRPGTVSVVIRDIPGRVCVRLAVTDDSGKSLMSEDVMEVETGAVWGGPSDRQIAPVTPDRASEICADGGYLRVAARE